MGEQFAVQRELPEAHRDVAWRRHETAVAETVAQQDLPHDQQRDRGDEIEQSLAGFRGIVAGGGFSYGDVLGAGEGWAKSILFNARAREAFAAFFARADCFALGVCNGCQMMGNLVELIPGAGHWPHFVRNRSEQFEGRLVLAEIARSPSLGQHQRALHAAAGHEPGDDRGEANLGVVVALAGLER